MLAAVNVYEIIVRILHVNQEDKCAGMTRVGDDQHLKTTQHAVQIRNDIGCGVIGEIQVSYYEINSSCGLKN